MSTNKQKFNKKYGFKSDKGHSISEISKLTGISVSILNQVMSRGRGAHKSNPQSVRSKGGKKIGGKSLKGKMSATQWGQARIYSFVMKQPGTWGKADKDLADKVRVSSKKKK